MDTRSEIREFPTSRREAMQLVVDPGLTLFVYTADPGLRFDRYESRCGACGQPWL